MRRLLIAALLFASCHGESPTRPEIVSDALATLPAKTRAVRVRNHGCTWVWGVVSDASDGTPVQGALLSYYGKTALSRVDGSYRIDLGCPHARPIGSTTLMTITHPDYNTETVRIILGFTPTSFHIDVAMQRR